MKTKLTLMLLLMTAISGMGQTPRRPDAWEPLRFLIGKWEGTGNGQPGVSKVEREYRLVLNDKFLPVQNRSVYDPQPKNPKGEIHEDWGMISFVTTQDGILLLQKRTSVSCSNRVPLLKSWRKMLVAILGAR